MCTNLDSLYLSAVLPSEGSGSRQRTWTNRRVVGVVWETSLGHTMVGLPIATLSRLVCPRSYFDRVVSVPVGSVNHSGLNSSVLRYPQS